ncbi:hypothetical protein DBV15_06594 [Temnothorax longispinosus]|uniref:Uncharacterized protein n=1 Tax=Temnothorax longispinosus TaxID=300112 RepID=A0A4V3SAT9_9HYME|nr:hypothetical protein DBV15_06594 [Temnothorax longispinosus]
MRTKTHVTQQYTIGKSCLLARIKIGTPALSGLLAVLVSSIFASSSRSMSQESTTKIIPSVHLVREEKSRRDPTYGGSTGEKQKGGVKEKG